MSARPRHTAAIEIGRQRAALADGGPFLWPEDFPDLTRWAGALEMVRPFLGIGACWDDLRQARADAKIARAIAAEERDMDARDRAVLDAAARMRDVGETRKSELLEERLAQYHAGPWRDDWKAGRPSRGNEDLFPIIMARPKPIKARAIRDIFARANLGNGES